MRELHIITDASNLPAFFSFLPPSLPGRVSSKHKHFSSSEEIPWLQFDSGANMRNSLVKTLKKKTRLVSLAPVSTVLHLLKTIKCEKCSDVVQQFTQTLYWSCMTVIVLFFRWGPISVPVRQVWVHMAPGDIYMIPRLQSRLPWTTPPSVCRWEQTKGRVRYAFLKDCSRNKLQDTGYGLSLACFACCKLQSCLVL